MPSNTYFRAAAAATGLLASTVSAAFNAGSSSNVAVYWGQGYAQLDLSEVCSDDSVDIVNLAFVNQFPKEIGQYPATNFGKSRRSLTQKENLADTGDSECLW
jgi:chitinase